MRTAALATALLLVPATALADECTSPSTCVPAEDMKAFTTLLKERKCLQTEQPQFKVDPLHVIIDKDGRIYGSGSQPVPWSVHMKWCTYDVTATGQVQVTAAMREPAEWGFRFRPKAAISLLGVEAFKRDPWTEAVDVGFLVEPFFFHSWNVNVAIGLRSFGAGIGMDITRNFGAYAGWAMTYADLRSNPQVGFSFSFW